ncbi:unnamed protein product [Durusdinium trenchii]|uniref:Exostosin GT47 domain-containing protein n=1 Tax=Durusdinium trenchii TaxID=1381693 RepID=A0ABP0IFF6_9DINO
MRLQDWPSLLVAACLVQGIVDPDEQEKRLAWKYLDCSNLRNEVDRPVDWPRFRQHLLETPYPENMDAVFEILNRLSTKSASSYDEEARSCLMGVPAAFFYLTRFTLDTMERDEAGRPADPEVVKKATLQYSVFENYISALHPGLINAGNWSFNDEEVFVLRKRILRAYRQLEAKKSTHAPEFKVYVYDEEEVPQLKPLLRSQIYCSRGQWGTDVQVHDYFFASDLQTDDPDEADFFFVPGYAICVLEGNLYSLDEVDELYKDLVTALPYFNASGGRDHIFVFGSGMAQSVFQSWEEYIPQSIVLTPETELFNDFAWVAIPPYRPFKDIVIPGSLDLIEVIAALEKSKPLHERRFLSAFFGRADVARGPHPWVGGVDVRKELLALRELPGTEDMKFGDGATLEVMHEAYGDAKFCFVPRGKSGWSLRFFEVIFAGCIPVMISDKWELPFEDFLDVTRFVIKWPSTQIGPQLIAYLRSLPDSTVQEYMDEAKKIRCWYFYPPKAGPLRLLSKGDGPPGEGTRAKKATRAVQTDVWRASGGTSYGLEDLGFVLKSHYDPLICSRVHIRQVQQKLYQSSSSPQIQP